MYSIWSLGTSIHSVPRHMVALNQYALSKRAGPHASTLLAASLGTLPINAGNLIPNTKFPSVVKSVAGLPMPRLSVPAQTAGALTVLQKQVLPHVPFDSWIYQLSSKTISTTKHTAGVTHSPSKLYTATWHIYLVFHPSS